MDDLIRESVESNMRHREIEALKIEAYLGTVERVLYYDAEGNLLSARI